MVAHSSDMQDLSCHTILRHLRDTTVPLHPRQYSYSSNYDTKPIITPPYQYRRTPYRIHAPVMTQDTETPTTRSITIMSLLLLPYPLTRHARFININTDGLITAYMHQYCNTGPTPSQCQAPGHDTDRLVMVILADCSICTA
jgi:hypothetical protein